MSCGFQFKVYKEITLSMSLQCWKFRSEHFIKHIFECTRFNTLVIGFPRRGKGQYEEALDLCGNFLKIPSGGKLFTER